MNRLRNKIVAFSLVTMMAVGNIGAINAQTSANTKLKIKKESLTIVDQGMFSAGGIVVKSEGEFDPKNQWEESGKGQTKHADHANVFYQIPEDEKGLPMVFLHGYGQSRMAWMTTPDGREGWSDIC